MYSFKYYHGGCIVGKEYVRGSSSIFDGVDPDLTSLFELKSDMASLGYIGCDEMIFHCKMPNGEIKLLSNDRELLALFPMHGEGTTIIIYVVGNYFKHNSAQHLHLIAAEKGGKDAEATHGLTDIDSDIDDQSYHESSDEDDSEASDDELEPEVGIKSTAFQLTRLKEHRQVKRKRCIDGFVPLSDDLHSPYTSDSDFDYEYPEFVDDMDMEQDTLTVGMKFASAIQFRTALKEYAVSQGFDYRFVKNESTRVTCICRDENCKWRIHASPMMRIVLCP